jgi:benzylsuccinate CoA-transferase BbsF subunit
MTSHALAGVRVIELSEVWAGPVGGSLLGDLGADVIKLESYPRHSPTRPIDPTDYRVAPGEGPAYERSWAQHQGNRNKRNMAINLRNEAGAGAFRRLLTSADVVVDSFSAGTMEKLGFGWEEMRAVNPRLIRVSLPGWGLSGPYQGYVAFGSGFDCVTGHLAARGYPWRPPQDTLGTTHSDATVPLTLVFAVVAALRERERTGEGLLVDLSQVEELATQIPGILAEWTLNGRLPQRVGNTEQHVAPHDVYQAAGDDRWVVLAAEDDEQWAALVRAAGHPEWAEDDHPWASVVGRLRERQAIDRALAEFAAGAEPEAIADAVQAEGGIAAPVSGPEQMLLSPQLNARGWFPTIDHPYTGRRTQAGFLWRLAPDAPSWDLPCGLVGEYNRELLREHGYSDDEIDRLEADGAIGSSYG